MNFLTLGGLTAAWQTAAIAGALGAVAILIAMYFLKLKRQRKEISSTFLWKKSIQDLRANSPFQRLRRNLLLFLQLAILIAALLALGRPALLSTARNAMTNIVLIDNSASMASTDVSPSRLAAAASRAQAVVSDMGPQDQMMVLTFGSRPQVVATLTSDKQSLRAAVRGIETGDTATDVIQPLELADSLARTLPNPRIIVISDGAFGGPVAVERIATPIEFVSIGSGNKNAGITAMDVRRSIDDPEAGEIFAKITNFSDLAVKTNVSLLIDGKLADAAEVTVNAGESQASVFKVSLDAERTAEVSIAAADDLDADNRAWVVLEPPPDVHVTVVGGASPFLRRALAAGGHFKVGDAETEPPAAADAAVPVYVYEGSAPASLGRAGYLIFNAVPPAEGFKQVGEMETPVVLDVDTSNPVTAFLDLGDIFVEKARKLAFPAETKVLVNSDEAPLVGLSYVGAARVITVAFDPMESRWPLRISYPMFVSNAVNFLASGGRAATGRRFAAGDVLVVEAEPGATEISVTDPTGQTTKLACEAKGTVAYGKTAKAGLYTVTSGEKTLKYAANLTSTNESEIRPMKHLEVGSTKIAAKGSASPKNREIWPELLIAAFVILMVEWYVYNRRVYV